MPKKIYFVGIKGFGMSSLALIYKKIGNIVFGTDVDEVFPTDTQLIRNNIPVFKGFNKKHITSDIDMVVYTGAHGGPNNIEVIEAVKKNIPVFTHAQALGEIMSYFKTKVSVCGTHGKTTTSAFISFLLYKLGVPCGYLVGAPGFCGLDAGGYTGKDYFVAEADEYANAPGFDNTARFLFQDPDIIIALNIEHDHPDVYSTIEDIEKTFKIFFEKIKNKKNGFLIYCADDKRLSRIASDIPPNKKISYGFSKISDYRILDIVTKKNTVKFTISPKNQKKIQVEIALFGKHNILNSSAVVTFFLNQKIDFRKNATLFTKFTGADRRFQRIFAKENTILYDDYAHHPTEIIETLKGAKMKHPNSRIILIFQPHSYSRTKVLYNEFIDSFGFADKVFLLDIFVPKREESFLSINSKELAESAKQRGFKNIKYLSKDKFYESISKTIQKGDVIITAGAGDIYLYHPDIIRIIENIYEKN